jgi:hypothetical protein
MNKTRKNAALVALGLVVAAAFPLLTDTVNAADHLDAPKTKMNQAADITDVYAWHTGDGKVVAVLNFSGFVEAGQSVMFDANVLYTIHVDSDDDKQPDHEVLIRFGQNGAGNWGFQISDLPGGAPVIEGPVGTTVTTDLGLRVWAGQRDDPFFFDLAGFNETLMSGTLSFDPGSDTFAKTNVGSIIVEMSTDAVVGAGNKLRLWGSTRVKQ